MNFISQDFEDSFLFTWGGAPHPQIILVTSVHGCGGRGDKCHAHLSHSVQAALIHHLPLPWSSKDLAHWDPVWQLPRSPAGHFFSGPGWVVAPSWPGLESTVTSGTTRGLRPFTHSGALDSILDTLSLCVENMVVSKMNIIPLPGRERKYRQNNTYCLLSACYFLNCVLHTEYIFSRLVFTTTLWGFILQNKEQRH